LFQFIVTEESLTLKILSFIPKVESNKKNSKFGISLNYRYTDSVKQFLKISQCSECRGISDIDRIVKA
jgi:hypothetical protein